jgi:hypothetical protein
MFVVSLISEFDIFAPQLVQVSVVEKTKLTYKPIASVDQNDLEFLIPADSDMYIDLDIKVYIRDMLNKADGTTLDNTDFTAIKNNFLHSLFSPCSIALYGVTVTPASDLYNYHSFFETILTYVIDAAASHLTYAFVYLDNGDLLPCNRTIADAKNKCFITRLDRINHSKDFELDRRINSAICNVAQHQLPAVRVQIKLTKVRSIFYLINKDAESKQSLIFSTTS